MRPRLRNPTIMAIVGITSLAMVVVSASLSLFMGDSVWFKPAITLVSVGCPLLMISLFNRLLVMVSDIGLRIQSMVAGEDAYLFVSRFLDRLGGDDCNTLRNELIDMVHDRENFAVNFELFLKRGKHRG